MCIYYGIMLYGVIISNDITQSVMATFTSQDQRSCIKIEVQQKKKAQ